ncbi:MAG: hypothetical protein WBV73_29905 [Phormidium sp.]
MEKLLMLQNSIEPINAEDLPATEYRFVKAQQNIYELCQNIEQEQTLKSSLENAKTPEEFRKIAYDGLALSLLQNTSDQNTWSNYSSGNLTLSPSSYAVTGDSCFNE